ncbi:signal transducer and activator of transcription C-like [Trichogramma pretiosum]|uniref:signal transducer and activator of transcription C-like n=1 Tax=Trichogramma pretiosum TaxID=7493 RepID=UPI000C719E10|nr:signal transducer and activator of transcription C-like [Trichogramma pretiosum]
MEQKHRRDAEETRAWYERQLQRLQQPQHEVEQQYRREFEELRAGHERQLMLRHHEEERRSFVLEDDHRQRQREQEQQVDALQQQHHGQLRTMLERQRQQLEDTKQQQLQMLRDRRDEEEMETMLQLIRQPQHRRPSADCNCADCVDELRSNVDFRVDYLGQPYRAGLRRDLDVAQDLRVRREPSQPDPQKAAIGFHGVDQASSDSTINIGECDPEDAARSQLPMVPVPDDQQSLVSLKSCNDDDGTNEAAIVPTAAVQERVSDDNDRVSSELYPDRPMHHPYDEMFRNAGSSRITMVGRRGRRRPYDREPEELREPRVRLPVLMAAQDDNNGAAAAAAAIPAERLREDDDASLDEANRLLSHSRNFVPRYRRLLRRASRTSKRRLLSLLFEFLTQNDR